MSVFDQVARIPRNYWIFIIVRLLSFFIIGFETFFGAKIVGVENYGLIEYEKQLINLASILLLGVHSGYGFHYYKNDKKANPNNFILVGILHSFIVFVLISLSLRNDVFSFGIVFYLISFFLEQILKINNKFNLAILYKPILSVLLIGYYASYFFYNSFVFSFRIDLNIIYLLAFFFFLIVVYNNLFKVKLDRLDFKSYFQYFKTGFEPNLTTSFIAVFFFIDRFIIEKYFNDQLGLYSIAYNFSYISFLLATSVSYVTTIKFGERIGSNEELSIYVKRLIKLTIYFLAGAFLMVIPLIYLTGMFWFKQEGFIQISLINFIAKTFFGACAFVSPIIVYKGKERLLWSFMLVVLVLTSFFDLIAVTFLDAANAFIIIQCISSALLIGYSIYVYYIIRNVLKIKFI